MYEVRELGHITHTEPKFHLLQPKIRTTWSFKQLTARGKQLRGGSAHIYTHTQTLTQHITHRTHQSIAKCAPTKHNTVHSRTCFELDNTWNVIFSQSVSLSADPQKPCELNKIVIRASLPATATNACTKQFAFKLSFCVKANVELIRKKKTKKEKEKKERKKKVKGKCKSFAASTDIVKRTLLPSAAINDFLFATHHVKRFVPLSNPPHLIYFRN